MVRANISCERELWSPCRSSSNQPSQSWALIAREAEAGGLNCCFVLLPVSIISAGLVQRLVCNIRRVFMSCLFELVAVARFLVSCCCSVLVCMVGLPRALLNNVQLSQLDSAETLRIHGLHILDNLLPGLL